MVGLKISREVNRPKRDNIVDGAGYFETLEMVKEERSRRESMLQHPSLFMDDKFIDWHNANKDIYGVNNPSDWNTLD